MTDAYSAERAGYAERLARLAGGTTWREPMEGHATRADHLPDVHAMAASLAFARRGEADIGPDVALAVILKEMTHREKVIFKLSKALLLLSGFAGQRCADYLPRISAACYRHVCTGLPVEKPEGVPDRDWEILSSIAIGQLWDAVAVSVRRAEHAFHAEAA